MPRICGALNMLDAETIEQQVINNAYLTGNKPILQRIGNRLHVGGINQLTERRNILNPMRAQQLVQEAVVVDA